MSRITQAAGWGLIFFILLAIACERNEAERQPQVKTLWVDAGSEEPQEIGTETAPFRTIAAALAAAEAGTVVRVKSGEYRENVVLSHGITLRGESGESKGSEIPVLRAANPNDPVVVMRDNATIEFFRITDGQDGILVDVNTQARIFRCEIVDNADNGIAFEEPEEVGDTPATVQIEACLVSGNKDGIDLEGTKGVIRGSRLVGNRDDGVDFDGDTDCTVVDNEIRDNEDDGIEIRLERRTLARIEKNLIVGNGEDGIEIINTPIKGETENRVIIAENTIRENARYGIGGVDQQSEEVLQGLIITGILLRDNMVERNGKADIAGLPPQEAAESLEE